MEITQRLQTQRRIPLPGPDGITSPNAPRGSRFDEQYVLSPIPTKHILADEGSYFVATNAVLGTAIAAPAAVVAFSATGPWFAIYNNGSPSDQNAKRIYLDGLSMVQTVAAASTTSSRYAVVLDNVNRQPSAGAALLTPVNPNMDDSTASIAKVWSFTGGAVMTAAAAGGSARTVASGGLGGLPVLGDELAIVFGTTDSGGTATSATACRKVSVAPPVVIGPGQIAMIYLWFVANATTGPSMEFTMSWWER